MINFSVAYLPEHNAITITATVASESGNVAWEFSDDKEKFVHSLEASLNHLINGKRAEVIYREPLSKGIGP